MNNHTFIDHLKQLINTPLSPDELTELWRKNKFTKGRAPKVVNYDSIIKARSLTPIFGKSDSVILFYPNMKDGYDNISGHYVALIKHPKTRHIYFSDSYGGLPDVDQKKYALDRKNLYNEKQNSLINLLLKKGWDVDYNESPLQSLKGGVATCGRWSLARCYFKDLTNYEFVAKIKELTKQNGVTPDAFVTLMFN